MGRSTQGKSLCCRLGIHTWVTPTSADARWRECGRCGTYRASVVSANRFPPGGSGDGGLGAGF